MQVCQAAAKQEKTFAGPSGMVHMYVQHQVLVDALVSPTETQYNKVVKYIHTNTHLMLQKESFWSAVFEFHSHIAISSQTFLICI
jgi:hypothetical protein